MLAIIQSRMSSSRLPGKALLPIGDKPMLLRVVEQVKKSKSINKIVIATSIENEDQSIVNFCKKEGIEYFCGDLNNVALRFYDILKTFNERSFVRISGDSPLIDNELIDLVVNSFLSSKIDLATNIYPRTFPKGQSVEVISSDSFNKAYSYMSTSGHYENVTEVFYEKADLFRISSIISDGSYNSYNLSVDTADDYLFINSLYDEFGDNVPSWEKILTRIDCLRNLHE